MVKAAQAYNYDTHRVPLIGNLTNRETATTKDQAFWNGVIDVVHTPGVKNPTNTQPTRVYFNKRGGFTLHSTPDSGGGVGRGIYYWTGSAKTYSVVDDVLYSNTTSIQTLTTSTGKCWFHEATGTTDVLIICDGTKTYTISTSDTVTEITDAQFPTSAICPVSLDGYLFVLKSGTDDIYNSDVDDPTAWTTGSVLPAEMYPDNLVALERSANYVVGFGRFSTEFFYNNNNATGSPLQRSDSVALRIGLAARDTIGTVDKRIFFVGQGQTGDPSVWAIDGLTPAQISDEFIDKILAAEGSNLSSATAYIITHMGHTLYVLNLNARTCVYDILEKIWMYWSHNSSGTHAVLPYPYATQGANNTILVLHTSNGKIYKLDPTLYQDDLAAILCWIITSRIDFGHTRQKRQFRFELVADKETTGTCTVEWSDDDYGTWGAARTLDLTARPFTKAGGVFRRRAYRIKKEDNYHFRAEAMELDISDGVH